MMFIVVTPRDHDGYITKMEYMQLSDKITEKQVRLAGLGFTQD